MVLSQNIGNVGKPIGKHTTYKKRKKIDEDNYNDKGKLDGESKRWYSNGKLMYITNYADGEKAGEHKRWNEKGDLIEYEIYDNDTLVQKIK